MSTFYIKRGDTLPVIEGVITDENGDPLGLAGCTVRFGVRKEGKKVALLDQPAVIVNASAPVGHIDRGRVRYLWQPGDTGTTLGAGDFEGEFQVTLASGDIGTAPNDSYIGIVVTADIAAPST